MDSQFLGRPPVAVDPTSLRHPINKYIILSCFPHPFTVVFCSATAGKAFRAIDEEGVGYIETARMNELLMSKGTPFRAKEIEAFMSAAKVRQKDLAFWYNYQRSMINYSPPLRYVVANRCYNSKHYA